MRWIVVIVHVHSAELDVIRLRSDHFNKGGTLHESKGKFVCVGGGRGGVKTTRTLVKGTAGAAESGIGKVFFFFLQSHKRASDSYWQASSHGACKLFCISQQRSEVNINQATVWPAECRSTAERKEPVNKEGMPSGREWAWLIPLLKKTKKHWG